MQDGHCTNFPHYERLLLDSHHPSPSNNPFSNARNHSSVTMRHGRNARHPHQHSYISETDHVLTCHDRCSRPCLRHHAGAQVSRDANPCNHRKRGGAHIPTAVAGLLNKDTGNSGKGTFYSRRHFSFIVTWPPIRTPLRLALLPRETHNWHCTNLDESKSAVQQCQWWGDSLSPSHGHDNTSLKACKLYSACSSTLNCCRLGSSNRCVASMYVCTHVAYRTANVWRGDNATGVKYGVEDSIIPLSALRRNTMHCRHRSVRHSCALYESLILNNALRSHTRRGDYYKEPYKSRRGSLLSMSSGSVCSRSTVKSSMLALYRYLCWCIFRTNSKCTGHSSDVARTAFMLSTYGVRVYRICRVAFWITVAGTHT